MTVLFFLQHKIFFLNYDSLFKHNWFEKLGVQIACNFKHRAFGLILREGWQIGKPLLTEFPKIGNIVPIPSTLDSTSPN